MTDNCAGEPQPTRLTCPACGRYLGTVDGSFFEAAPCACGIQTTVRGTVKRLRERRPFGVLREIEAK
jgi:hypothetical protein